MASEMHVKRSVQGSRARPGGVEQSGAESPEILPFRPTAAFQTAPPLRLGHGGLAIGLVSSRDVADPPLGVIRREVRFQHLDFNRNRGGAGAEGGARGGGKTRHIISLVNDS